ncbi:MAG: hypothetical protein RSF40_01320 [Oscillospiraceae bacterium]
MSVNKNTYGIIGFDLTNYRDKIITEEFEYSDLYEKLTYCQKVGKTQLFTDPMDGDYLYFGYIFFKTNEEYINEISSVAVNDICDMGKDVLLQLRTYFPLMTETLEAQVLVFNEFT